MDAAQSKEINYLTVRLEGAKLTIANPGGAIFSVELDDSQKGTVASALRYLRPTAAAPDEPLITNGAKASLNGFTLTLRKLDVQLSLDLAGQSALLGGLDGLRQAFSKLQEPGSKPENATFSEYSFHRSRGATPAQIGDHLRARTTYTALLSDALQEYERMGPTGMRTLLSGSLQKLHDDLSARFDQRMQSLRANLTPALLEAGIKKLALGFNDRLDFELQRAGRYFIPITVNRRLTCEPDHTMAQRSAASRRNEYSWIAPPSGAPQLLLDSKALATLYIKHARVQSNTRNPHTYNYQELLERLGGVSTELPSPWEKDLPVWSSAISGVRDPRNDRLTRIPVFAIDGQFYSVMEIVDSARGYADPKIFQALNGECLPSAQTLTYPVETHTDSDPPDLPDHLGARSERPLSIETLSGDIRLATASELYDRAVEERRLSDLETQRAIYDSILSEAGENYWTALDSYGVRLENAESRMRALLNGPQLDTEPYRQFFRSVNHTLNEYRYFMKLLREPP